MSVFMYFIRIKVAKWCGESYWILCDGNGDKSAWSQGVCPQNMNVNQMSSCLLLIQKQTKHWAKFLIERRLLVERKMETINYLSINVGSLCIIIWRASMWADFGQRGVTQITNGITEILIYNGAFEVRFVKKSTTHFLNTIMDIQSGHNPSILYNLFIGNVRIYWSLWDGTS